MARKVALKDADRSFDIEFWQAQSSADRVNAANELIEFYFIRRGKQDELRLQRHIESFKRRER